MSGEVPLAPAAASPPPEPPSDLEPPVAREPPVDAPAISAEPPVGSPAVVSPPGDADSLPQCTTPTSSRPAKATLVPCKRTRSLPILQGVITAGASPRRQF